MAQDRHFIDIYDRHYTDGENVINKKRGALKLLKKCGVKLQIGSNVLEPGCGVGILGSIIGRKYYSKVFGIELSNVAIRKAKLKGITVKKSDLNRRWPFKSDFFDLVISSQVIEHLTDTDNFVTESLRVLKPGGMLVISTPNLAAWFNRLIFLFGFQPFNTEVSRYDKTLGLSLTRGMTSNRKPMGHIKVFTLRALVDLLEFHGFMVVKCFGGTVNYMPRILKPFDILFSFFPSLSSDIYVTAKRK